MPRKLSVIIRQHPVVIVRNLIFMELFGYAVFVGAGALADYGAIYKGFSLGKLLSYQFAQFIFIVLGELIITGLIFCAWSFSYYEVTPKFMTLVSGIFRRRKTAVAIQDIDIVSHEFGVLGKLFQYGSVILQLRSGEKLRMCFVGFPDKCASLIMRFRAMKKKPTEIVKLSPIHDPRALIAEGEHERLEFKSTMRWDLRASQVSRNIEKTAIKTIAAFLNSGGGRLVIGVDDRHLVLGLDHDYKTLNRTDRDGFENHFTHVFNAAIGVEFRRFVRLQFTDIEGKEICIVHVEPASRPVFVRFDNTEEFYVRTGNSTTPLRLSEAASYLNLWRRRSG